MNKALYGKIGEDSVIDYLKEKRCRILERNFRYRKKEVDIIAEENGVIIFVEVKVRRGSSFGTGLESINNRKIDNIASVAIHYLKKNKLDNSNVRFDVASIDNNKLLYIKDAFQL